jgi:HEPN domain-containing protein
MNEKTVINWIKKANEDLKIALDELNTQDPASSAICFHAQQCVEKYLKAFLIYNGKPIRKTHNITAIIKDCTDLDKSFEYLFELEADELTKYAVEVRYGEEEYFPSVDEAREAVEIAKKVKEFVLKKLKERGFNYE